MRSQSIVDCFKDRDMFTTEPENAPTTWIITIEGKIFHLKAVANFAPITRREMSNSAIFSIGKNTKITPIPNFAAGRADKPTFAASTRSGSSDILLTDWTRKHKSVRSANQRFSKRILNLLRIQLQTLYTMPSITNTAMTLSRFALARAQPAE